MPIPFDPRYRSPTLFDRIADGRQRLEQPGLLSDDEKRAMRSEGLLGFGAAMLRASGPSQYPIGLGRALGEAIPAGQEAEQQGLLTQDWLGQRRAGEQVAERRAQIMQRYTGAGEPGLEQFQGMLRDLVSVGDIEGARPIAAVLQSIISRQRNARQPTPRLQAGVDPDTGQPGYFRVGPEGGAEQVPGIEPTPRAGLSVQAAYQILKDRYAKWKDDGSGKLVFDGYEKTEAEMLAEARAMARGGPMTPRAPGAPEVEEEEEGSDFFGRVGRFIQKTGQTIWPGGERGFLPPRTPSFSREETQKRAKDLEAEGKTREQIRRIMQSEGYRLE